MFFIRPRRRWIHNEPYLEVCDWRGRLVDEYVHHTADHGPVGGAKASIAQEEAYLRTIDAFHRRRGYKMLGYSYMIMPSGRVWECRGFERVGAHTLDPKDADGDGQLVENRDLGVCFAGNFMVDHPTPRALLARRALRARLRAKGVRLDQTYPHRACYATSCPGDNLMRALNLHV